MQITRSSVDTAKGAADWFTGDVYIDAVAAAPPPSRVTANLVHFMPGARTHWHRHPLGQTVFITDGVGLCQRHGEPVEIIRPRDRVLFEADEEHWHGAAPNRLMVHLAINEGDDQHDVVHWLQPVTDQEYTAAPPHRLSASTSTRVRLISAQLLSTQTHPHIRICRCWSLLFPEGVATSTTCQWYPDEEPGWEYVGAGSDRVPAPTGCSPASPRRRRSGGAPGR